MTSGRLPSDEASVIRRLMKRVEVLEAALRPLVSAKRALNIDQRDLDRARNILMDTRITSEESVRSKLKRFPEI